MDYYGAKSRGEAIVSEIKRQESDPHKRMTLLAAAEGPIKKAADEAYQEWVGNARRQSAINAGVAQRQRQ